MIVRIQGFAWEVYTERVMPAFARWLVENDDTTAFRLFEQTRCAQEELFVPQPMRQLRTWTRAKAFVQNLPRGSHTQQEYELLCDPIQFTPLSDRYVQAHPPQLYKDSEALRTVWGAMTQQFCLPWYSSSESNYLPEALEPAPLVDSNQLMPRTELIALLHSADLSDLAEELPQITPTPAPAGPSWEKLFIDTLSDDDLDTSTTGIIIGRQPASLHMRGWLASHSVRAMALFELLACGRRVMPFGYLPGDPYGGYIGYLMPEETGKLASSLEGLQPPERPEADNDLRVSQRPHAGAGPERMVDEITPTHAEAFLDAVRIAAQQQLGLICSIG